MDREAFEAEHGPFFYNLNLDGWTLGPDQVGMAEQRVAAVARVVTDTLGPLDGVTVLDLGAHHGGFGLELAARGAQVTFVEGRPEHVSHAQYAADTLGVADRCRFVAADVRGMQFGRFDVVLCLGLLYHLPGRDLTSFARRLREACGSLLVCETQVAMEPRQIVAQDGGREYRGIRYGERAADPGASIDGEPSAWLTRASLVNLLADAGFTTITELLAPRAEASYLIDDHVVLLAHPGQRTPVCVVPLGAANRVRMPEKPARFTHEAQGWRWRVRSRLAGAGKNFWATLWQRHPTPPV